MEQNIRLAHRLRYQTWVRVVPSCGSGLIGNIEDISTQGLGIAQDKPFEHDGECHVYFLFPLDGQEHLLQARCRVASCRADNPGGPYHIGLAFISLISEDPAQNLALIRRFVQHLHTMADETG